MLGKTLIHCTIDRLPDMPDETLPAAAAGRRQFLDALLFETSAQLRLTTALLPVSLVALAQFAIEGAVMLAIRGGEKVGNPDIYPDHWRVWLSLYYHHLIGERQPPAIFAPIELNTTIDGVAFERLPVILCQFHRYLDGMSFIEGADLEPIVKSGVCGGFKLDDIDVGLNAGLAQGGNVQLVPGGSMYYAIQCACCSLLLIVCKLVYVILIRLLAIAAPGLCDPCRLLNCCTMPAFR